GDTSFFFAHFLYAKGRTVVDLVQPYFTSESSCAEFHRPSRRNYCGNLLSIHWSGGVPFGRNPPRLWGRKTILSQFARGAAVGMDRFVYHIGCLFASCAAVSFAGLARGLQHSGTGRVDWIRFRR